MPRYFTQNKPDTIKAGLSLETDKPCWPPSVAKCAVVISVFMAVIFAVWNAWDIKYILDGHGLLTPEGQPIIGGDFVNFWTAARLALTDRVHDLFNFAAYRQFQGEQLGGVIKQLHWSYPPHVLLLIIGFGFLPYTVAFCLWACLTFLGYAFAVSYKRPSPWMLSCALFFCPSSFMNIILGQNGFLSAALLVGGLRLLNLRPVLAGVLFGLLTFKPQLGLLVPVALLAGRHWQVFASAIITTVLLIALSLLIFGGGPWLDYLHVTLPFQHLILTAPVTPLSLFQNLMPTPFMALRILGISLNIAALGTAFFVILALFAVVLAFTREVSEDLRAGIVLTAALLATPHALVYDMTCLSAAVVAVMPFAYRPSISKGVAALLLIVWLLPVCVPLLNLAKVPLSPLIIAAFLTMQVSWLYAEQKVLGSSPGT
jgi:hypothetical protein